MMRLVRASMIILWIGACLVLYLRASAFYHKAAAERNRAVEEALERGGLKAEMTDLPTLLRQRGEGRR